MNGDVKAIILNIFSNIGHEELPVEETTVAGQHIFSIQIPEADLALFANNPDVINALDHLVKKIVEKNTVASPTAPGNEDRFSFLVDIGGKRIAQIKDLESRAMMMADRARSFQYDVELAPMSAYERLIVHTTLQDSPKVRTESQGEGFNRRVVIKYVA
ncbi:MAG: spoII [Candidatus Kaiserbacteria bacterium]|nr:spoII [Candidatus Kaiserbacteria bacterium]